MRPGRIALRAIILALCAYLLASCAIFRPRPPVIEYRDSVRVEYQERTVHDTAFFQVPVEVEKIVTRDTASHLQNSLATSDAVVSGGLLHHTLATRPQSVPVPVAVTVRDTVYIEKSAQVTTEIVEGPAPLTWWQRFRIGSFYWLLALAVIGWRRELLALLRKII